ncbi:hypothetical protein ES319_D05G398300v1 [Gossypium barbadense]|uniref:Uncharacterized protein n=1 Tax=Gossypium barbadense TaxID=3634 RepID=A0A5J5RSG5_GOSBA|nr:hypothetical protein ES319_D05G398300v1 [Gossypium barbadense]
MASVTVAFSPITTAVSAPSSSVSDRRISVRLPGFRGLKSKSTSASVVPLFRSVIREPLIRGRGGRVVCEAQETAFDEMKEDKRTAESSCHYYLIYLAIVFRTNIREIYIAILLLIDLMSLS